MREVPQVALLVTEGLPPVPRHQLPPLVALDRPFVAIVLVVAVAPALRVLHARLGWRLAGAEGRRGAGVYRTVITLTLSFLVFTCGSLLVAIQVASGQLTPPIIATTLLRDRVVQYSVGLFVFSLIVATMALDRQGTEERACCARSASSPASLKGGWR